jgi:fluoride ion exporter CrcB/FEX
MVMRLFIACGPLLLQIVDHVTSVWLESLSKGIMACLSTVSTFMVEVLKLSEGPSPWKSYAYIAISLFLSQLFALILYGIPVWTERYPGAFPTDPKDFEAN